MWSACSYKNRSHCKYIPKEKIRRHVFVVYVLFWRFMCYVLSTHCQNLGAIGQIPYVGVLARVRFK